MEYEFYYKNFIIRIGLYPIMRGSKEEIQKGSEKNH